MSWSKLSFLKAASDAILPALSEAVPAWVQSRKRLVLHDGTQWNDIAYRSDFPIGTLILNEFSQQPGELFPAIPRNVDNDLDAAHWPLFVPLLRAEKASILGTTDFTVTVSGSTVTFPSTTSAAALISLLKNDAIAANYQYLGEPANFDGSANYAVAGKQRCLNIAGVDYAITGTNLVGYTVTVSGSPATGSQTACCYTYRIAGSTTTARLRKMSGFVGVVAGDAGGEVVGGFFKMDRTQGHWHNIGDASGVGVSATAGAQANWFAGNSAATTVSIKNPITDGTNGTPRTGKTTDPRTYGQYAYTWGGKYVA
jgi:hypothetical protein